MAISALGYPFRLNRSPVELFTSVLAASSLTVVLSGLGSSPVGGKDTATSWVPFWTLHGGRNKSLPS